MKFTLRHTEDGSRRLVYGTNFYSRMVVGEICKGSPHWMPRGHKFSATKHWADGRWESFKSLGEARKWLEDGFRAEVLGEVGR